MDIEKFAECSNLEDLLLCDTKIVRLGEYDYLASAIRMNTTQREYLQQYNKFVRNLDIGDKIRTSFHELTHFFQYHTTPFGMYLLLLCQFQIIQLKMLIYCVREKGRVEYPLIPYICRNLRPANQYSKVWYHLKYWYLAELVRLYFIGDFGNFCYYYSNSIFQEELPSYWFSDLEKELCKLMGITYIKRIEEDKETEINATIFNIILRSAGDLDASNIFENQARMEQYWWETGYRENPFSGVSEQNKYSGLIAQYTQFSNAENFTQFHERFYAICELALFSPILPFQAHEEQKMSVTDLNPVMRVLEIMRASQSVKPIQDMGDHRRFLDEVSEILNYPSLNQILGDAVEIKKVLPKYSYDRELFLFSQSLRQRDFSYFYNLGRWHPMAKYQYEDAQSFTECFIPPIVEFKDQTLFFKPGEIVQPIVERYFLYYYLRELLIGFQTRNGKRRKVPVWAPFYRGEKDLALQNYVCNKKIKELCGDGVPEAVVVRRA